MVIGALLFSFVVGVPSDSTLPACVDLAGRASSTDVAADLASAFRTAGKVVRWEFRTRPTVTVWVQATRDIGADRREAAIDGMVAWAGSLDGLRIVETRDSASADVRLVWTQSLGASMEGSSDGTLAAFTAGRTTLAFDSSGVIHGALVTIATEAPNGARYQPADILALARHEFGHVLGLGHHRAPTSVMASLVVDDRIGRAERLTLRALYSIAPGTRCR